LRSYRPDESRDAREDFIQRRKRCNALRHSQVYQRACRLASERAGEIAATKAQPQAEPIRPRLLITTFNKRFCPPGVERVILHPKLKALGLAHIAKPVLLRVFLVTRTRALRPLPRQQKTRRGHPPGHIFEACLFVLELRFTCQ
jgi:hypothetical protein